MVTFIQRSNIRDRPIADGDVLFTRSNPPGPISACDYAFRCGILCATAWPPSTFERIVVDELPILFDASSNRISVGRVSGIATPMSFQLLLTLARAAPEVVPYAQLDDVPATMDTLAFEIEPRIPIHKRKSRLNGWLQEHDIPLNVYNVRDYGYGLTRLD